VTEPTLPSHHSGTSNVSAAFLKASSKRMMSQPMGSSAGNQKPKLMHATNSTTRSTKAATRQVWGGFKQVGRRKSLNRSAFPKLPQQLPVHHRGSACMTGAVAFLSNHSPIAMRRSKQRAKQVGRRPNLDINGKNCLPLMLPQCRSSLRCLCHSLCLFPLLHLSP